MDIPSDMIQDNRVATLGLSMEDFREYLLNEGIVTSMEVAAKPAIISELATADELWMSYEEFAEDRYLHSNSNPKNIHAY